MPSSGGWKIIKVAVWPVRKLLQQIIVHYYFSHTPVRQAADETDMAYVNFINLQPESCGKQYAHGRKDAQKR